MINVTQTYLPDKEKYFEILKRAWDKKWITNNGELLLELETKLKDYLGVKYCYFTGNGTIALQIAIKALDVANEVITTPFSYVATTNSILWEKCTPVFVDINDTDYNIDPSKIERLITPRTQAIMAVHVYGNPCHVFQIEEIARKHNLKVIYDGAHAFGTVYKGKQLLSYGDISTCSFHATKLFHTVEGGCIITNDDELARKIYLMRSFGHESDNYYGIGINGKNSEFHAAMGLAVLPDIELIINKREELFLLYKELLKQTSLYIPEPINHTVRNYAYFPVVFDTEEQMLKVKSVLFKNGVNVRRYFYPSLNLLPHVGNAENCPISENVSKKVICLPLFPELNKEQVVLITNLIKHCL